MLAPSALARRLTAPRKHSRPVLSKVCPLLYKTVENPAMGLVVYVYFCPSSVFEVVCLFVCFNAKEENCVNAGKEKEEINK